MAWRGPRTPTDPRLKGRPRARLRQAVAALGLPCQHPACLHPGVPIDYRYGARGPLAYHLDEIVRVCEGGSPLDPSNVRPTHADCNLRDGARIGALRQREAATRRVTPRRPVTSRQW